MNSPVERKTIELSLITRREAIRRTAVALGIAITPALLDGLVQAQTAGTPRANSPAFLTAKQYETVTAIAERILPKTDTPGAIDVGVPAFIDLMYGKYLLDDEKQVLSAGLGEVESLTGGRAFAQLSPEQQDGLLRKIAEAAQEKEKTFFHLIKELTLLGYFNSEHVGKNVLHYDPIPGRYDGCIPLLSVGNVSWTR
jgi:gluconate 2-dehydrogenase gamma chain